MSRNAVEPFLIFRPEVPPVSESGSFVGKAAPALLELKLGTDPGDFDRIEKIEINGDSAVIAEIARLIGAHLDLREIAMRIDLVDGPSARWRFMIAHRTTAIQP